MNRDRREITHLIRHNHHLPVPKVLSILVILIVLQAENLLDILNLLVLHNLVMLSFAHVEQLSTKWEDPIVVAANDTQTSHS